MLGSPHPRYRYRSNEDDGGYNYWVAIQKPENPQVAQTAK